MTTVQVALVNDQQVISLKFSEEVRFVIDFVPSFTKRREREKKNEIHVCSSRVLSSSYYNELCVFLYYYKPKLGATVNEVRDLLEEQCREFKGKLAEQEILNQMGVTGYLRRHRTGNA